MRRQPVREGGRDRSETADQDQEPEPEHRPVEGEASARVYGTDRPKRREG